MPVAAVVIVFVAVVTCVTERDDADGEVGQEEDADENHCDLTKQRLSEWVVRKWRHGVFNFSFLWIC